MRDRPLVCIGQNKGLSKTVLWVPHPGIRQAAAVASEGEKVNAVAGGYACHSPGPKKKRHDMSGN